MISSVYAVVLIVLVGWLGTAACAQGRSVNDAPGRENEWGFRPEDGAQSAVNPPGFVWRRQGRAASYEFQCARDSAFTRSSYRAAGITLNCHCPPKTFAKGKWHWRFRFTDRDGQESGWSKTRSFTIGPDAVAFPMPTREELLGRIPKRHPRLLVRPGQLPNLRRRARGDLKSQYDELVRQCEALMKNPPPTREPQKYPPGTVTKGEAWREIWWGNRRYTIKLLDGAATLAFTRLLGGRQEYGQLARRLLLAAAAWDPKGSTGYHYNDEAGMPYNYYFSRTYTFVNDLLTEEEKETCRRVMRVRGTEMYRHLCPRHLWRPYGSHQNRAWHFLGEIGIAFLDEIPEAADWVWFAANVFYNVYPVWCDSDGGWHEGVNYWSSYINRFTWWADVMRAAFDVDAYKKPYFSKIGYYPMYLQPPGTRGGGFGDLTARRTSRHNLRIMSVFATQARNPYWQWYVNVHGDPRADRSYIGFLRGVLPKVEARPPADLPSSRCFRGTGQAVLNTNLLDARKNVEIIFKSSPFGSLSHGYEAQNSFLLYAFGERLLIRSGRRDSYGSKHHDGWMWHTKSVNSITVNGQSQAKHSQRALGSITSFHTSDTFDYVAGEAGKAYGGLLQRFTRSILFIKPELIVIYDRLEAPEPSSFEWRLHAPVEMVVHGQSDIHVVNKSAACRVSFLAPSDVKLSLTDKFDPPPRPRIKLKEWHLTAQTSQPVKQTEFVTLIRPHRADKTPPTGVTSKEIRGGYAVEAETDDGKAVVLLRAGGKDRLTRGALSTTADLAVIKKDRNGKTITSWVVEGTAVRPGRKGEF